NEAYKKIMTREGTNSVGEVKVITFENLLTYAKEKLTEEKMDMLMSNVSARTDLDKRDKTIRIVDAFMLECPELTPAMVLFFAPPYYPAVNTSNDTLIKEKVRFIQEEAETKFHLSIKQVHYFNGISDLSYVNYDKHDEGWKDYIQNMPTWGEVYNIPFSAMQQLQAPVLNIGPFGKDAHKVTERLHERSAFVETPWLVEQLIRSEEHTSELQSRFDLVCDLSNLYLQFFPTRRSSDLGWKDYIQNMPTWGEVYNIPFSAMQQLQAPVLNIGPFGKDAHKVTERLHERSAFVETPWLVEQLIRSEERRVGKE